jgi:REP-associated tyrosine transposase
VPGTCLSPSPELRLANAAKAPSLERVPRPPRSEHPGAISHLTARGNGGEPIFLDDYDRVGLLQLFALVGGKQGWQCLAYCLMGNHYHLLVRTPEPTLAVGMHAIQARYARGFNERHGRSGHLFGSRYFQRLVESESHVLTSAVYTVLNPVRARLVQHPAEWLWSSYRATIGLEPSFDSLRPDVLLDLLTPDRDEARTRYEQFIDDALIMLPEKRPATVGR